MEIVTNNRFMGFNDGPAIYMPDDLTPLLFSATLIHELAHAGSYFNVFGTHSILTKSETQRRSLTITSSERMTLRAILTGECPESWQDFMLDLSLQVLDIASKGFFDPDKVEMNLGLDRQTFDKLGNEKFPLPKTGSHPPKIKPRHVKAEALSYYLEIIGAQLLHQAIKEPNKPLLVKPLDQRIPTQINHKEGYHLAQTLWENNELPVK